MAARTTGLAALGTGAGATTDPLRDPAGDLPVFRALLAERVLKADSTLVATARPFGAGARGRTGRVAGREGLFSGAAAAPLVAAFAAAAAPLACGGGDGLCTGLGRSLVETIFAFGASARRGCGFRTCAAAASSSLFLRELSSAAACLIVCSTEGPTEARRAAAAFF